MPRFAPVVVALCALVFGYNVCASFAATFGITLNYGSGLTADEEAVVNEAASYWQTVITGYKSPVGFEDGFVVTISGATMDGPKGTLAGISQPTGGWMLGGDGDIPVEIEIVDLAERIDPLLEALDLMIGEGMVTVSDVHMRRYLHDPNAGKK